MVEVQFQDDESVLILFKGVNERYPAECLNEVPDAKVFQNRLVAVCCSDGSLSAGTAMALASRLRYARSIHYKADLGATCHEVVSRKPEFGALQLGDVIRAVVFNNEVAAEVTGISDGSVQVAEVDGKRSRQRVWLYKSEHVRGWA